MRRLRQGNSPFNFDNLKMVQTTDESKAINFIKESSIIIAGSGMVTGGRIKHHLVNNITRPENTVLFVGYQAEGTPGSSSSTYVKCGQTIILRIEVYHERKRGIPSHREEPSQGGS